MFEKIVFERIQDIWNSEQVRCNEQAKKNPPEFEALRAVVETAFLASLKKEEGQPVEFSLALMTEKEIESTNFIREYGATQVILRFHQALPFNVESITKIASAFDKNTTTLAVESAPNSYQIWGALFYGPTTNLFDEVNSGSTLRPDCLIVKTASAGSLAIARGQHLLGHFESGKFNRSVPSPFTSEAMGNYVIAAIKRNRSWDSKNSYWHIYRDALELVLAEASRRGHGGTIVLIPPADVATSRRHFQSTYSFTGDLGIGTLIDQTMTSKKNDPLVFDIKKRLLARRLKALAQLASVDRALIITTEWEVLAFGANLATKESWTKNVLVGPDAFGGGGGNFERSKLGTRHNSAIDFIGACPAAICFVISEDGPIRGFAKRDDETILCWPDCRVSMSV